MSPMDCAEANCWALNGPQSTLKTRDIQLWLGHSTYQTTADIYTHLDYRDKMNTANAAADMVLNIMHKDA